MAKNKIIFGGEVLIDLTADTVTQQKLLKGVTAHDKSGEIIEGSCEFDSDTSDATFSADELLEGQIGYARGVKIVGEMPNNGGISKTISNLNDTVTIPQGHHDGQGTVTIATAEKEKIIAENIREGVTILGVVGSMSGNEGENAQENIDVTPTKEQQIITPSSGYTCLRQVTVAGIPYVESENAAGGITVTIG